VVSTPDADPNTQYGPEWRLISSQSEFVPIDAMDLTGQVLNTAQREWTQTGVRYRIHCGPHRIVAGSLNQGSPVGTDSQWLPNSAIDFLPVPSSRYAVQVFYVPKPYLMVTDSEPFPYDHEEWIIRECAARCLEKERSPDASVMRAGIEQVKIRIRDWAQTKDAANPPMMSLHKRRVRSRWP
jgi:hypothetical protein